MTVHRSKWADDRLLLAAHVIDRAPAEQNLNFRIETTEDQKIQLNLTPDEAVILAGLISP